MTNTHKKTLLLSVIIFLLWSFFQPAAAQNLYFQNYSSASGLPDRGINSFAEDAHGAVWVRTDEGICMFDGESFIIPAFLTQEPFMSISGRFIFIDAHNTLWMVTEDGLLSYSLNTGETELHQGIIPTQMICDGEGIVWARTRQGLLSYDPGTDSWDSSYAENFQPVHISAAPKGGVCASTGDGYIYIKRNGLAKFRRIAVLSDDDTREGITLIQAKVLDDTRVLYTTSDNSAHILDVPSDNSKKIFDGHRDGKDATLMDILAIDSEHLWVATDNGLFICDETSGKCTEHTSQNSIPFSLPSSKLRCLFKDSQDRIWVGSFYDGVSRLIETDADTRIFRVGASDPGHSLRGKIVISICEGDDGIVWAATEDGFLEKIYPDGMISSFGYGAEQGLRNTYQAIAYSEGRVYAVSLGEGLSVYDAESLKMLKRYDVGNNVCHSLYITANDEILSGTSSGLYRLDRKSDSFVRVESVPARSVSAMCEDWRGNIWASTRGGQGVTVISPMDFNAHPLEISGDHSMDRTSVSHIFEDRDGRMILSTGKGLHIVTPDKNTPWKGSCIHLGRQDGLPSNICRAVTQDNNGKLWVSTKNGIASIVKDTVTYVTEYGIVGNYFSIGAILNASDGLLYFGSSDGMVAFRPAENPERTHSLFLTDIVKMHGNTLSPVVQDGHSAFTSESIRIHSTEASSLTFHLMCVKSDINEVVRYSYSLAGKGREFISSSRENQITYANLTPGKYLFTASVNGDDSPEALVSVKVRIIPPFYASALAKPFYILFALGALAAIIYLILTSHKKEKERAYERLDAYKQQEVYESKINFFTTISHEIRTPLTLIKLPLDKIISSKSYLPESEYDMKCIQDSTNRLLELTDQILDFRKMENGSMQLSFSQADMTKLVEDACKRLEPLANEYSVTLTRELPEAPLMLMCAPGSIDKIISNLLMNGIKYCRSSVSVKLEAARGDIARLTVISDGELIDAEERERIFEPFYRSARAHSRLSVNEGTGLGLSLSRPLAALHGGKLTLDSDFKDGNSFVLELPMSLKEEVIETEETEDEDDLEAEDMNDAQYSILIVEDDTTMNDYIKTELSSEYTVYQAYNGKQAISVLNEKNISLIVSDIMMPEMDGCELVDTVKNTLKFSHVPIILLTAVTDYNTQLNSLHSGADGYITKPFSMQILRATIFNTLKNREILYERFSSMPFTRPENTASSQDDELMKNLYDYVLENISNQDLSVLDLADKMNVSRSTLYRKIKTNTGMNINEYIRVCRLKKAAELLSTQKYQAKEVAYMVGFTNMSYFTKSFQKQFNMSPSSLIKKG